MMLTMQDITILEDQAPGMCSSLVLEQLLGVAKDNQQYHYQLEKQSTEQRLSSSKSTWLKLLMED